jgi:hypothetical protein
MLEKHMRLDELLGRDLTIRWFEGVALIQAVCRQLVGHEGRDDAFPTAAEIVLAEDGTVVHLHPSGHTAVRTAAQLLGRMLSDDVPVRLRLIVAQATGTDTAYPTLKEFSGALAYFERPDGAQVLRALYERAMVAPVRTAANEAGDAAPLINPEEEIEARARSKTRLRLVVGAAVTAACVLAGWFGASAVDYTRVSAAFTSFASGAGSRTSRAPSPARARKPLGTVAEREPASANSRPSAPARDHSSKALTPSKPRTDIERTTNRATAATTKPRPEPVPVAAVLPLYTKGTTLISPATDYRPVFGEAIEVKASEAGAVGPATTASLPAPAEAFVAKIYSRADGGVTPPRSVYPKLPSDAFSEEPDNRTVLELVIGTNGLVERAILRSIPRDIHEFMLVSAAKAWIFEPATIEGLPVRYRHRVRISLP